METIGIKIFPTAEFAKVVKIVRKYENLSVSEIKKRIIQSEYIILCDDVDDEGLEIIISLYNELSALNIPCELFEDDSPTDIQLLCSLQEMYDEINEYIDKYTE